MINPQKMPNLISKPMGDGLAVFDPLVQKSYLLNATSAFVLQQCDGATTPQQLTQRLRQKFNMPGKEADQMMWLALDELEKANLLQGKVATTQAPQPILTRRQALRAFAAAGLSIALLPIVSQSMAVQAAPLAQAVTTGAPTTTPAPVFPFTGFFLPVDNPPVVNEVKAGQGIPVKFSLSGDRGLGIIASGYPVSYDIPCDGSAPVAPVEETTTSPSGLSYNASTDQYTYVWKTEKSWAGTCREFKLRLTDGTDHVAKFSFK